MRRRWICDGGRARERAKRPRELRAKTGFRVLRVLVAFLRLAAIDNESASYAEINVSSTRRTNERGESVRERLRTELYLENKI